MISTRINKIFAVIVAVLVMLTGVVSVSADEMTQKPDVSVIGNADLDSSITIQDATAVQLYLAKYVEFTDEQNAVADVNKDSDINIVDVTNIQKYLARYNEENAIGETVSYHEAVYEYIEHDAVTEKKWVETKAAYTYEEPIYETRYGHWCNDCGIELTNWSDSAIEEHCGEHLWAGGNGSWSTKSKEVQVGTKIVEVPPEGFWQEIYHEAWTEEVLVKEAGWY